MSNKKYPNEDLFERRPGGPYLKLDEKPDTHVHKSVDESLAEFYRKLDESYTVPIPERIESSREFIRAVHEFAEQYGVDIVIREGLYFVEAVYRDFGGAYPRDFCRDFTRLLSMCDRFDFYNSAANDHSGTFSMQYDTHEYYFGGKKFNEHW